MESHTSENMGSPPNGKIVQRKYDDRSRSDEVLRDMAIQKTREKVGKLQLQLIKDIDKKLDMMVEEVLSELQQSNTKYQRLFLSDNEDKLSNRVKSVGASSQCLAEKHFEIRNSYLLELFQVKHIRTIYNIFIVFLFISFINLFISDFVEKGEINLGQDLIILGFAKIHYAAIVWGAMFVHVMLVHPFLWIWSKGYNYMKNSNQKMMKRWWNTFFIVATIVYQMLLYYFSIQGVVTVKMPIGSSTVILLEMLRMSMKIHSYIRTNAGRVIGGKGKYEGPAFLKYLYFFFCPTLIYRDEYPRTKVIRWKVVFWHFLEVIGVMFFHSYLFSRFMFPAFVDFGRVEITLGQLMMHMFGRCLPSVLIFLSAFFLLLHAWLNAFSEMLRFGDRMFYKDWWNATSFDVYYRTWNVVVHDWLYQYVYKEVYEHVFKGSKVAAALVTFTVSAIFHELALSFMFKFFYPVLFVFFNIFGVVMMFVNTKKYRNWGNMIVWLMLSVGLGLCFSLYTIEWFARENCGVGDSWKDYFIPVSWTCNKIVVNPNWEIQKPWK